MFTSLCCPNKVVGLQRSVSGEDKGHGEEVLASSSSITDDQLRCLLLKAITPATTNRDKSSILEPTIKIKNRLKTSQNYQNGSSCNLSDVRSKVSEPIEKIDGRREKMILCESCANILAPIECCDCSVGVSDKYERDERLVKKEIKDSKNVTSRNEIAVKPDNQKQIDAREGGTENTSFSTLISKTYDEGSISFSRPSFVYRHNCVPTEFCGWSRSGSNEDKQEDRICGNFYQTYCHRNATKEMFAPLQDKVYRASSTPIEKEFTRYMYSSGDENNQFLQNIPCRSQTYSRFENYCSNATLTIQISDDLEFSNSKDDHDDDDSDISYDSITKFRVLPENSTSLELQQCITLDQNIEREKISLPGATEAQCAKVLSENSTSRDFQQWIKSEQNIEREKISLPGATEAQCAEIVSEKVVFSYDIVSEDHQIVPTFDSTSKMSDLSLGENQEGNELTLRPLNNVESSFVEHIDNDTLEEQFLDKEEITTKVGIDGTESAIVPSDEHFNIPSDESVKVPSEENIMFSSEECDIVPSDKKIIVPSDEEPRDGIPDSIGIGSGEEVKSGIPENAAQFSEQEGKRGIPDSVIIVSTSPYGAAEERCHKNGEYCELDDDDDSIMREIGGVECARVCTGLYGQTERQLSSEEELALIDPSLLQISPHLMSLATTLDKMDKRACNVTLRLYKKSKKIEEERSRKRASALDSSFKQRPTAVQMRQQMHRAAKLKKYELRDDPVKNNKLKLGFKSNQNESSHFKQKGSLKRISKAPYCTNLILEPPTQQSLSRSSQRRRQKAVNGNILKKRANPPENYRTRELPDGLRDLAQGKFVEVKDKLTMTKRKQQYQLQHKRKVHSRLHQKTKMLLEDVRQAGETVAGERCNRE